MAWSHERDFVLHQSVTSAFELFLSEDYNVLSALMCLLLDHWMMINKYSTPREETVVWEILFCYAGKNVPFFSWIG